MFENNTEQEIKKRMLSRAPAGINTDEGDFFNDAVSPAAIEFTLAYMQLDNALKVGFAETSYGQYLENIAKEHGIQRNGATQGSGSIEVAMNVGAVFTKGDVLATKEGNLRFVAAETKTVGPAGKETLIFKNETPGNLGSIPSGTVFIAPLAIPGFISASNPETLSAGTDAESDDALRQRYFEKIQTPATSGNINHYRNWAKEIPGVGDVKVLPLADGPNTVKVILIDANKQPASDELVGKVQNHIDPGSKGLGEGEAPIGAKCTVVRAQSVAVNIVAKISGTTVEKVQPVFEKAVDAYLASIAFKSGWVSFAKIGAILLDSIIGVGGADYSDLTVNGGDKNIEVGNEQVAVRGTVVLS